MKLSSVLLSVSSLAVAAAEARNFSTISPTGQYDPAAATFVHTVYPAQHHYVHGKKVKHIWNIVLGAQADYDEVKSNDYFSKLADKGVTLTNYHCVSPEPQANYLAMVGGDTFGLGEESFVALPKNVSTLADVFEDRRVMWTQYMEGQPFTAFPGYEYQSPDNDDVDYRRAYNPFVQFDSVTQKNSRMVNLKSLKSFYDEYNSGHIAQWLMIRPNLYNDGSKSDLDTAGKWLETFLSDKLDDKHKSESHLFFVTFATSKDATKDSRVFSMILGDVDHYLKKHDKEDNRFYNHYSILSSAEANYELPSLGRYDCRANVFNIIDYKANIGVMQENGPTSVETTSGWLSDTNQPLPVPNLNCPGTGRRGVLKRIKKTWKKVSFSYEDWVADY